MYLMAAEKVKHTLTCNISIFFLGGGGGGGPRI